MNYEQNTKKQGKVWLVGAGPSDQELLTVKGKRLLSEADVIVYDRLAGQGVLTYGAEHAEYIDVGKHSGNHRVRQSEINQILVREAMEGKDHRYLGNFRSTCKRDKDSDSCNYCCGRGMRLQIIGMV